MTLGVMTHADIRLAAELLEGCRRGARVHWSRDDGATLNEGVLRYVTDAADDGAHGSNDRDIRTQFVRISTAWEFWLPVAEIFELMRGQMFIIQGQRY